MISGQINYPLIFNIVIFQDRLLNDVRFGNFDRVITLTRPDQTSKSQILQVIQELKKYNLSKEDTVLLYFSTHGSLARTENGALHQYIVTRDTIFDAVPQSAIDVREIKAAVNHLESQKTVLVFAFCHSGSGKSQLNNKLLAELGNIKSNFFVQPIDKVSEASIILAASAWGETAVEDDDLQNDLYTHFLIEGIRKNDRNDDGAVTVTEAHDYAKEQTYYRSGGKQRPSMESIVLGVDPIILSGQKIRSGKPVIYDYSKRYEGMVVMVDGKSKGSLPLGVAVEPGVHLVELSAKGGNKSVYEEVVRVEEGDQLFIPRLLQGYEQGTAIQLGYQGFLTDKVDQSVSKPQLMIGMSHSNHTQFSSNLGYRADLSYGQAKQTLLFGPTEARANVRVFDAGVSLLYRYREKISRFIWGLESGC